MDNETRQYLQVIREFPSKLKEFSKKLNSENLDVPIRENAWTPRQIINHLPDSFLNSYIRIKLMLTEEEPPLKGYDEARWAELVDYENEIEDSISLIEILHRRFLTLIDTLNPEELNRSGIHSEVGQLAIRSYLKSVSEHGPKHLDSIKNSINSPS